jgi:hypothetical protein
MSLLVATEVEHLHLFSVMASDKEKFNVEEVMVGKLKTDQGVF